MASPYNIFIPSILLNNRKVKIFDSFSLYTQDHHYSRHVDNFLFYLSYKLNYPICMLPLHYEYRFEFPCINTGKQNVRPNEGFRL